MSKNFEYNQKTTNLNKPDDKNNCNKKSQDNKYKDIAKKYALTLYARQLPLFKDKNKKEDEMI